MHHRFLSHMFSTYTKVLKPLLGTVVLKLGIHLTHVRSLLKVQMPGPLAGEL